MCGGLSVLKKQMLCVLVHALDFLGPGDAPTESVLVNPVLPDIFVHSSEHFLPLLTIGRDPRLPSDSKWRNGVDIVKDQGLHPGPGGLDGELQRQVQERSAKGK